MERRKFIQNSAIASVTPLSFFSSSDVTAKKSKLSFIAAHITDVHVKPDPVAEEGMRMAFRHVNSLKQKPDFIINGGDAIMDAMAADKNKTLAQWDVWNRILKEENRLPIHHCIGNHDAWGWQVNDESIQTDPLYNKGWALKQHNMSNRYYSFENAGWKFIVLDSAHKNNGGYIAKIDEEQFAWLENELKNTSSSQHICIVSHIPIASFCAAMFFDKNLDNGDWRLPRNLLHTDTRKLKVLFKNYSNIRCCISGHIHLQDELEYLGIKYYCNGAVSGNWWGGSFQEFAPAYAVMELFPDGTVKRTMIKYEMVI
jgi:3',5'-cyclic AMP phosphodiesterase CpdA